MSKNIKRAYKYRFYPQQDLVEILAKTFGCVRFIYNKTLDYSQQHYLNKYINNNNLNNNSSKNKAKTTKNNKINKSKTAVGTTIAACGGNVRPMI